jgi:hypothetical protein
VVADPASPEAADTYNRLEPRGDDVLFRGHPAVRPRRGRPAALARVAAGVAAIVALTCLLASRWSCGRPRGVFDALAPIAFLVLVAALTWLSFRGHRSRASA